MKKIIAFALCMLFCSYSNFSEAIGVKPEPPQLDEAYLLGVYAGSGKAFILRESSGKLDILRRYLDEDKDFSQSYIYPLQREHYDLYTIKDADTKAPSFGSDVSFERDKEGRGISARVDTSVYTRRYLNGEDGKPFRFKLEKKWSEIIAEAKAGVMPKQTAPNVARLVDLSTIVPSAHLDLRYTTHNNCFGNPLVNVKKAYLDKNAAQSLAKVSEKLKSFGYGLIIWEAYRPWSAFKLATVALPRRSKSMLPRLDKGYSHNTGMSIDVSLYTINDGKAVQMICDFDVPTPAQYRKFIGGSSLERWERDLLGELMSEEGFKPSDDEWWHFDYKADDKYQLLDIPLESLQ